MKRKYVLLPLLVTMFTYGCKETEIINPRENEIVDSEIEKESSTLKKSTQANSDLVSRLPTTTTLYGTANSDFIQGTSASEQIIAYASNDQVYANGGDDVVYGGKGNDYIQGNSGSDLLRGDQGSDRLYGGTGNDDLYGGKDNDELYGEDGNDKLYGDQGNDNLYGGAGNDTYYYNLYNGYDIINDASGTDILYLQNIDKSQVSVSYSGNNVVLNVPSGRITIQNRSIETVYANGQIVNIANNTQSAQIAQYADNNWRALLNEANGQITAGTACAAFVSATLRKFDYNIWATVTDGTPVEDTWGITLKHQLLKNGYRQSFNAAYLEKGDICFTINKWFSDNNGGNYYPTHCYFFLEWVTPGRTDYAWVVDNQGKRHQRNLTVNGSYDKFQYFMYKD